MTIEAYPASQMSNRNENIPIIRLSNSENLSMQNIIASGKAIKRISVGFNQRNEQKR